MQDFYFTKITKKAKKYILIFYSFRIVNKRTEFNISENIFLFLILNDIFKLISTCLKA